MYDINILNNDQYIIFNFNLPNHDQELILARETIAKIKLLVETINVDNSIDDRLHNLFYEETIRVLDFVGNLSAPAFTINKELETMYLLKFPKSPELAKKLWLDHYGTIHRPYSILKNRCYRILKSLDKQYISKFNKYPPNWNY